MTRKPVIAALIALGSVLILLFGLRLVQAFKHWDGPPHPPPRSGTTDVELIRDWMTVPYVAHMYGVPPPVLFSALGIPERPNRRMSLAEINAEQFPDREGFVLVRLQEAIQEYQMQSPQPPRPLTPNAAPTPSTP